MNRSHSYPVLVRAFLEGTLDTDATNRFLDHLESGCDLCLETLRELHHVPLTVLPAPRPPRPWLKTRIMTWWRIHG